MRHDKFTSKFQMAIADAQSIALGRDHQFIEPVHLMQALLDQNGGSVRPLFTMLGVDIPQFRANLSKAPMPYLRLRAPAVTFSYRRTQLNF